MRKKFTTVGVVAACAIGLTAGALPAPDRADAAVGTHAIRWRATAPNAAAFGVPILWRDTVITTSGDTATERALVDGATRWTTTVPGIGTDPLWLLAARLGKSSDRAWPDTVEMP